MPYQPCRDCGFQVLVQPTTFCPNCGIYEPFIPKEVVEKIDAFTDPQGCVLLASMGVGALAGGYWGAVWWGGWGAVGLILGMPVISFLVFAIVLGLWNDRKKVPFQQKAPEFLKKDEELVTQRLQELDEQEKGIATARTQIEQETATSGWTEVAVALEEAAETIPEKRRQYKVKLWAIALVRWHNTLEPLREDWDTMTAPECNRRIEAARAARAKGEALLQDWEAQTDMLEVSEAQITLARLRDTLTACNQLLQALVAKQAILALKDGDNNFRLSVGSLPESILPDAIDLFNARVAINEFSMTLKELESEHAKSTPPGKPEGTKKKMKGK